MTNIPPTQTTNKSKKLLWYPLVAVLSAVVVLSLWNPAFHGGGDNAVYMNMGSAIYNGQGLRQLHTVGTPPDYHITPGLPVILAGIMALTGDVKAVIIFKLFSTVCYWLFLLLFFHLLVKHLKLPPVAGLLAVVLLAASPAMSVIYSSVLTESPFLLFSAIAMLLLFRYADKRRIYLLIFAAIVSAVAVYIRFPGAPFAIGVFLWLLIGRRFKHAFIYAAVVAAAVAPWVLYVALNGEFTYVAHSGIAEIGFMGLLSRIAYHTGRYLFELLPVLLSPSLAFSKIASVVSGSILTLVVIAGLYSVIRKDKPRLIVLTLLCFIPVYLIYEFVSLRYISILAPAIVFLIACSGGLILKTLTHQERSAKLGSVIIVALLLVGMLPTFIQGVAYTNNYRRQLWKSESRNDAVIPLTPEAASFYKALRWCEKDTPEDAILISAELRIAYFISDRQGIWIGSSKSDEIWEKALKYGATYIILDRTSELILAKFVSAIEPHIKCFKTVYRTKEPCAFVLEIDTTCLREKIGD